MVLVLQGALSAARDIILPTSTKLYFIHNNTSGGFAVTAKCSGQTGVSIPNGAKVILACNGTDIVEAFNYSGSLIFPTSATITTLSGTTLGYGSASITNASIASGTVTNLLATTFSGGSASITTVTGTTFGTTGASQIRGASGAIGQLTVTSATITNLNVTSLTTGNFPLPTSATIATLSGTTLSYASASLTNVSIGSGTVSGNFNAATASGNVGIGTTAPASKLHIDVDGTALRITRGSSIGFLYNTGTASTDITRLQSNGGSVQLYTAGGTATLDASGNLGLGVTPSAWGAGKAIEVGFVGNSLYGNSSNNMNVVAGAYFNSGFKYAVSSLAVSYYNQSNGAHAWLTASSGTAGNAISFTQAMTLDASGNLGIGTTSPWEKLSVPFNAGIALGSSTYSYKISRSSSGELVTTFSDTYDASTARVDFVMRNGAPAQNTALSILGTGNVGIGTTSPSAPLDVVSDGSAIGLRVRGRAADNFGLIQFSSNNAASDYAYIGSPSANQIAIYTNGFTERMRIDSAGNVGIGTSSPAVRLQSNASASGLPVTSGTTQTNGALRLSSTGTTSGVLDFGANGGSPWIQATDATDLSQTYNILLNPNGGNVGIGTASPSSKLEVNGNARFSNGSGFTTANSTIRQIDSVAGAANQFTVSSINFLTGAFSDAGQIAFSTAQGAGLVERMRIDSAGNLGLGVTPSAWSAIKSIQVGTGASFSGGSGFNDAFIASNAYYDGTNWRYLNSNTAHYSSIGGTASARWYTAPSGTAGNAISFTQAMTLSAGQKLSIGTSATDIAVAYLVTQSAGDVDNIRMAEAGVTSIAPGIRATGDALVLKTSGSERMRIDSAGNVGIGTSSPSSIGGSITTVDISGSAGGGVRFQRTASTATNAYVTALSGEFRIATADTNPLTFGTNNTECMRITSAGNVGIGTSSPDGKLMVVTTGAYNGSVASRTAIQLDNTNVTGGFTNSRIQWTWGGVGIGIKGYIEGGTYGADYLSFGFNTTESMRIDGSGNVGIGTSSPSQKLDVAGSILASGNVTAYSDIRVKDNVESIEGAIGKLNQIRGVTYTRTDLDDKHRRFAGVIAQEIEQVLPEAVFDNGKVKAVDYNATIALLIEAVKEQQGQINELKLTIEQLKGN
jgi:hypothetical protein